jgi:hypothetical protein
MEGVQYYDYLTCASKIGEWPYDMRHSLTLPSFALLQTREIRRFCSHEHARRYHSMSVLSVRIKFTSLREMKRVVLREIVMKLYGSTYTGRGGDGVHVVIPISPPKYRCGQTVVVP